VSALAPLPGEEIVDIGFGGGLSLDLIRDRVAPAPPIGVELSDAMIEAGRARWGQAVVLHKADVAALPFPDASLDGILSVNTIYFWPDLTAACREIRRVLKPGGRVVFGFRRPAMMRLSPITWFGFRLRPADRVEQCLRDAHFLPLVHEMPKGEVLIVGRAQHAEGIGE
jgi:ubiquinone/menaquinone biosynthesis C-methylase UbiE